MPRNRSLLAALTGVAIAGCGDTALPTAMPPDFPIGAAVSQESELLALVTPIEDAATRATGALADATAATALHGQLSALSDALRSGDLTGARAALRSATTTYEAYDAAADKSDIPDRAVIELAIELVDGALRERKPRR